MASIRYLVPYQLDLFHLEDQTNQNILNTYYLKTALNVDTPAPAYGVAIPGGSDTATVLAAVNAQWAAGPLQELSTHCEFLGSRLRAIVGYRYPTPFRPITNITGGAPVEIFTGTPHGYSNTNTVQVTGVTTPTGVNGTWSIDVTGPNSMKLIGTTASGAYTGAGYVQRVRGDLSFIYEDNAELPDSAMGAVAGDMLPAYVSADVRRINSGVGRGFRSRVGLGTLGEGSQAGGKLTTGAIASINAAMATFFAFDNGGSDSGSKFMRHYALSKYWALLQPSPFTSSIAFTAPVSLFSVRERTGSQNSRKARA